MKRQIADSISENLTDSDLESESEGLIQNRKNYVYVIHALLIIFLHYNIKLCELTCNTYDTCDKNLLNLSE